MKGLGDLMKQAQQVQEQMRTLQEEIARMEITGESGAGLVRVTMNGRHEVRKVQIDDSLMTEERTLLEDLVAAACNDAVHKVEQVQQEKMSSLTSGFNLPFGKMPF